MADIQRLKDLAVTRRDFFMIDPRIIKVVEGHNPRDFTLAINAADDEADRALEESIEKNGVIIPIIVRYESKDVYLVDGERRWRATMRCIARGVEIAAIPAIQTSLRDEQELAALATLANFDSKPLHPWEIGKQFAKFQAWGWPTARIADRFGYKERAVNEAIELYQTPEAVKRLLAAEVVTPAKVLATVRKEGLKATKILEAGVAEAQATGKGKLTRARAKQITQVEARALADALRTIIKESPNSRAATTARTALEGAGLATNANEDEAA